MIITFNIFVHSMIWTRKLNQYPTKSLDFPQLAVIEGRLLWTMDCKANNDKSSMGPMSEWSIIPLSDWSERSSSDWSNTTLALDWLRRQWSDCQSERTSMKEFLDKVGPVPFFGFVSLDDKDDDDESDMNGFDSDDRVDLITRLLMPSPLSLFSSSLFSLSLSSWQCRLEYLWR